MWNSVVSNNIDDKLNKENSMSSDNKEKSIIAEQVLEWLTHYPFDRITWLFACYMGESTCDYNRKDYASLFYDGVKGVKDMSTDEFVKEIEEQFEEALYNDPLLEDWEDFVKEIDKDLGE